MNTKHLLMCAAALAVGFAWGYQRANLAAVKSAAASGPVVGGGLDWLGWQSS